MRIMGFDMGLFCAVRFARATMAADVIFLEATRYEIKT